MNLAEPETLAIPGAFVIAVLGAVTLEVVRISGKTSSDVALAMLFYGGIAGGVLLIGLARHVLATEFLPVWFHFDGNDIGYLVNPDPGGIHPAGRCWFGARAVFGL